MSPSTRSSQSTLTRRACLNSLPTEVKSRIAELCCLQDEWWREYDKHIRTQFASAGAPEVAGFRHLHETEAGGREGLEDESADFPSTYREATRSTLPRAALDEGDTERFSNFLAFLPDFTCIKQLVIGNERSAKFCGKAIEPLWHHLPHCLDDAEQLSRSDIIHLIQRLESLSYSVPWPGFAATLKAATTLTSFSCRLEHATTAVTTLSTVLTAAPHLHSLTIDATDCELDFNGFAASSRTPWPTLTSVAFKAERINPSFSAFLSHHRASLRHLRLEWTEEPTESDNATFTFLPPTTFPALNTLDIIECGTSPLVPLLSSIKPASLPTLRDLTIVPFFGEHDESGFGDSGMDVTLDSIARQYQPRSLFVRYYESDCCLWPHCALVARDMPSGYNTRLDMTPISPYPRPVFYVPDDSADLEDLELFERSVTNTMDFLVSWHKRVKQSKDTYQYGHLASALKMIELERVAQTA